MEVFENSELSSILPIAAAYAIADSDSFLVRKIEAPIQTFYRLDLKTGVNLQMVLKIMNTVDVKFATAGSSPKEFVTIATDNQIMFFELDQSELGFNSETVVRIPVEGKNLTYDPRGTRYIYNNGLGSAQTYGIDHTFTA